MCRRVQEERPSWSTSGGQSGGAWRGTTELLEDAVDVELEGALRVSFLVIWAQAAKEVQLRHLNIRVRIWFLRGGCGREYGFPSGPRTTPFGNFFGVVSTAGDGVVSSLSLGLLIPLRVWVSTAQKNRERMGISWKVMGMTERAGGFQALRS